MTRETVKDYLRQIENENENTEFLSNRWKPEILCDLIDVMSDEDVLGLLNVKRICENCTHKEECQIFSIVNGCVERKDFGCTDFERKENVQ